MRSISSIRFLLILLLASCALAHPAQARNWQGIWVLRSDSTALFSFSVQPQAKRGLTVRWHRPSSFEMGAGGLQKLVGPVRTLSTSDVTRTPDELVMRFQNADGSPVPPLVLKRVGADAAELRIEGAPVGPFPLRREPGAPTLGPWDEGKAYPVRVNYPTNVEMTAIFEADQAARERLAKANPKLLEAGDAARRARTRQLLQQGELRSGDDYYHAAFVFQHGGTAADYLLAHVLAMAAMARGRTDAAWIAAATLDRYLQTSGSGQVLGTQFQQARDGEWTMEPYDRDLVPDSLRKALGVPSLADQEQQMKSLPPLPAIAAEPGS